MTEMPHHDAAREDPAATRRYLDLIRSVHEEWDRLEEAGDTSVQLSGSALATIKESVRADARHGAHVHMPPTPAGPFTVSELTLRTLVRREIDAIPGARALRTAFEHDEDSAAERRTLGLPTRARCRVSAHLGTPDLPGLAERIREAVRSAAETELGLTGLTVDVHIEDLHEH
ncbi:hypothetical protein [Brachybacterium saurashtrense]|uniref:hypothetical protein n=1 Tax=Brachybacterium saurashtrense TaxID=556288 RepID=UPI0019D0123F|nr:hypothetical protein [Brachybacterium saurashtrense]